MARDKDQDATTVGGAMRGYDQNASSTLSQPAETAKGLAASAVLKAVEVGTVDQIETVRCSSAPPHIPRTSSDRIARATPDICPDEPVLASKLHPSVSETKPLLSPLSHAQDTVLYLAYGSNMSAATFEGTRKIVPLSAVTVSVPTLRLTFDLPGIPYREPCFANVAIRKPPKSPWPIPAPPGPPGPIRPPLREADSLGWNGALYGVVYEVTRDDYARIIATEGGGASYQDILVPCFVVEPRMGVPEKPALPVPVPPFLAHTLCAPRLPPPDDSPDSGTRGEHNGSDDDGGDGGDDDDESWFSRCWKAFLKWTAMRGRPDPDYAQPSRRYLGLLTTGAAEHELPEAYQDWLASLQPYTVTTWRQTVGAVLLLLAGLPFLLIILAVNWLPRKKGSTGRMSPGMMVATGAFFRGIWWLYDHVFFPIFGDGERTEKKEDDAAAGRGEV
ncbi:hypothetical protein SEPCBS57363_005086 [Sporothrix epigloea]|uniref:gamma-glutamylcyclotransferase n=1 Tax=Sporothrix epigloea TaxID=1892477 RepID=A0ABP0DZJ7_9PEZI